MLPNIREIFEEKHEADFAYSVSGVGRFRVNAFYQRGRWPWPSAESGPTRPASKNWGSLTLCGDWPRSSVA